ncbi:MAG TPA: hypothetical protein PLQ78_04485 [Flavipsychrobacter sp.]|mgnify:CR=1 FL=1|jgi:hypothetical protein|nr:hypothetical protein [Flavipsychrobacter sp.]
MKQFILLVCLILGSLSSYSQTAIDNQTGCDVDVFVVCWDGVPCEIQSETPYTVPAGQAVIVSDCPAGQTTGYLVTWNNPACTGFPSSVTVGDVSQPCWQGYPNPAFLPDNCGCTNAGFATVQWSSGTVTILP